MMRLEQLPGDLESARQAAYNSSFIQKNIPASILDIYCGKQGSQENTP